MAALRFPRFFAAIRSVVRGTIFSVSWLGWALGLVLTAAVNSAEPAVELRSQRRNSEGHAIIEPATLAPARTAVVVIDMWDRHWCKTYTARVANLVLRMNDTLAAARKLGLQVVWAPSDVVGFYRDHPRRQAMLALPPHPEPPPVAFDPPPQPEGLDCCECGPDRPCRNAAVWTRQHAGLVIDDSDLIGDCNNAQELWNLCGERGIDTLIYLGVASNMCVQHRAFGLRNARRHGFRVWFLSDLVEAITANGYAPDRKELDPNFTPAKGTAREQRYLERYLAPSLESRQLIAAAGLGAAASDPRPRVVFVLADDEYKSEETLPRFAKEHLDERYGCTFLRARGNEPPERHDVPGLAALSDADLLVLSVRRRALSVPQMDHLERYVRAGKPLVALRVSVVPFQVEAKDRPEGHVVWRDFDREVLGCRYAGYNPEARRTGTEVWSVAEASSHPILQGLADLRFRSPMWLYRVSPLVPTCRVLLLGRWSAAEREEPVAWTNTYEGGRVFYTALGHWEDFENERFNRLLRQAIGWCLGEGQ